MGIDRALACENILPHIREINRSEWGEAYAMYIIHYFRIFMHDTAHEHDCYKKTKDLLDETVGFYAEVSGSAWEGFSLRIPKKYLLKTWGEIDDAFREYFFRGKVELASLEKKFADLGRLEAHYRKELIRQRGQLNDLEMIPAENFLAEKGVNLFASNDNKAGR